MKTQNVEYYLKILNIEQKDLAEKLRVNQNTIGNWKRNGAIPEKYIPQLERLLNNHQETKYGSNVNNVNHDSHDTYNYAKSNEIEGALCHLSNKQFSEIINLIKELNNHLCVKDSQITFCTQQINKLIQERDDLQKQLLEIYRTGKVNRD